MPDGARRIHTCREYDEINVPLQDLFQNGVLNVYPEIVGHGYFDINISGNRIVMRAKGWVGLIPISDDIAIHVHSRAPITNLLYMVWRSGSVPKRIDGFLRTYGERLDSLDSPIELYAEVFLAALREIGRKGPLKRYVGRESNIEKRGRLLLNKTVSESVAKGVRNRHTFKLHDLTVNNIENRILKQTADRIFTYYQSNRTSSNLSLAKQASTLLRLLSQVDSFSIHPGQIARSVPALVRALPNSHKFYEPALWLSYLIASRKGVLLETFGQARFETVTIDVASIFENYIRVLCKESAQSVLADCYALDGNRRPVPLFKSSSLSAKPDIYFIQRSGTAIAVADVKYKPKLKSADRYELIAFCNALNVQHAAFISPLMPGQNESKFLGTTSSGIRVHELRIDLSSNDLPAAERRLQELLASTLDLPRQ